jgi:hypothetical protein
MRAHDASWGRRKVLALLAAAIGAALLLVAGLVFAVVAALHPSRPHRQAATTNSTANGSMTPTDARDALATRAMPTVPEQAAQPGPVSTADAGTPIDVPAATTTGPARVPTGFPQTPAGALAQLAAIDQTAIQSGSLDVTRQVITAWGSPAGPGPESWSVIAGMADLLTSAGTSGRAGDLAIVLTPVMGLLKGRVGDGFVVPCVDFELDVTLAQTARIAVADCQRMSWRAGRWVIATGSEPATPPSIWPDTDAAFAAGYHDLRWSTR